MNTGNWLTISLTLLLSCTSGSAGETEALELAAALGVERRWSDAVVAPAVDSYVRRLGGYLQPRPSDAELDDLRARLMDEISWERVGRFAFVAAWGSCSPSTLSDLRRLLAKQVVDADVARRIQAEVVECTRDAEAVLIEHMTNALAERFDSVVQRWTDERNERIGTGSTLDAAPESIPGSR